MKLKYSDFEIKEKNIEKESDLELDSNLTFTVLKMKFEKKLALKQLALKNNLTIQELINKLIDLALEEHNLLAKETAKKTKKTKDTNDYNEKNTKLSDKFTEGESVKLESNLRSEQMQAIYDLLESEDDIY